MKTLAALTGIVSFAFAPSLSQAQAYPAKPVRLILPTTPGGAFELYGRVIAGDAICPPLSGHAAEHNCAALVYR